MAQGKLRQKDYKIYRDDNSTRDGLYRCCGPELAAMAQSDLEPNVCQACSGRGWKFVRARRALVIGTLLRGSATPERRDCLACDGTGRAT
jgi:hypothetical protein